MYLHRLVSSEDSGIVGGAPGGIGHHIRQVQNSISLSCSFQANMNCSGSATDKVCPDNPMKNLAA